MGCDISAGGWDRGRAGCLLGLPSSTAILLVLCGRERGSAGAIEMADASLLGLIAAVSLPIAYAHAVRRGWGLAAALGAAVAAYIGVAYALGFARPRRFAAPDGRLVRVDRDRVVPGVADRGAGRGRRGGRSRRIAGSPCCGTLIPVAYVAIVGIVSGLAGPRWAGLVSTFPSMSTVVLAVTHLEAGAVEASRIARALPPANLSTAAFLTAFRFGCPVLGVGWATLCGYAAALINLAAVELIPRLIRLPSPWFSPAWRPHRADARWMRPSSRPPILLRSPRTGRPRGPSAGCGPPSPAFLPFVEILPC